ISTSGLVSGSSASGAAAAPLRPAESGFFGPVGTALPRPMAIQKAAMAGMAMMMANSTAVTACGASPATKVASMVKPLPINPPSPVGSGQLAGMATKDNTPAPSIV